MDKNGLNRDVIKYIAMFTMLVNHVASVFLQRGTWIYNIMEDIGYFTAITMCYFLVEGYQFTRSKRKYGQRLLLFAMISQIPYSIAFTRGRMIGFCGMNILFTLFLCFLILVVTERVKDPAIQNRYYSILILASAACDWPFLAPIFTLFFIRAKGDKKRLKHYYGVSALIFLIFLILENLDNYSLGKAVLSGFLGCLGIVASGIVILRFYNGKRMEKGREFSKWFFYLFYPVHLSILGILKICIF